MVQVAALSALSACQRGSFPGEVVQPDTAPPERGGPVAGATKAGVAPAAAHDNVVFNWRAGPVATSGTLQATLPGGETFDGSFHEITQTTMVPEVAELYSDWQADTWTDPRWRWGENWQSVGSVEEFISRYTGKVVATLTSDRGTKMRCHFRLDDPGRGMKGGGSGECQLSTGERITTHIPPT